MQTYWNFEFGSEKFDLDCLTKQECIEWAEEWYINRCIENDEVISTDKITLVESTEDGEVSREEYTVSYEDEYSIYAVIR